MVWKSCPSLVGTEEFLLIVDDDEEGKLLNIKEDKLLLVETF